MKVKSLEIKAPQSYDSWTGLRGDITLESAEGTMKINLTPGDIAAILEALPNTASVKAKFMAARVAEGILESKDEVKLISSDGRIQLD